MDRELEQLLKDMTKELKDLTTVLRGSRRTAIQNTKSTAQEIKARKMIIKMMEDQKEQLKKRGELTEEFTKEIDESIDSLNKFQKTAKSVPGPIGMVVKGLKFLGKMVLSTGVAMAKTALALSDTTKSIQSLEDIVDAGFGDIPYVGKLMKEFGREIDANVEAFTQLAKSGATFGSSIVMLRKAQADSMMPLTKFTDLIAKNSGTLAKLFGTVDQGVPQIAGFMDSLGRLTIDEFSKFGLTLDDTSEYLGTFLELERARGNVSRMSQSQLLQGTADYTKNLVTLSKLTGESVDTLNQQNLAMAADGVFQSQLNGMEAGRAAELNLGVSQLTPGLKQLAREVIGLGAPISQTSKDLEILSGGAFGDAIKEFKNTGDLVAFQNSIKSISDNAMDGGKAFGQASLAGGGFAEALNDIAANIGTIIDPETLEREIKARGDNIVELRALQTETDRLKSAFETARFEVLEPFIYNGDALIDVGEGLGNAFEKLTSVMKEKLTPAIENFGKVMMGKDVVEPTKFKDSAASMFTGNAPNDAFDYFNFDKGSKGFQDFGSGTPAMLHGVEAVLPKDNIGDLASKLFEKISKTSSNTSESTVNNTTTNSASTVGVDMTILNNNTTELIDLNKKLAMHLNTLVTIGAMTEKNTKSTNNSLANMGGSLV